MHCGKQKLPIMKLHRAEKQIHCQKRLVQTQVLLVSTFDHRGVLVKTEISDKTKKHYTG